MKRRENRNLECRGSYTGKKQREIHRMKKGDSGATSLGIAAPDWKTNTKGFRRYVFQTKKKLMDSLMSLRH